MKIVAAAIVGTFVLQAVAGAWMGGDFLAAWGALNEQAVLHGQIWRIFTYGFVHSGLWPMLFNLLALALIAFPMQAEYGGRAMAWIYGTLTVAGGVAFAAVHAFSGVGFFMGAIPAVVGLLCLYCLAHMDRPITMLLFFVFPITILPRYLLYFIVGVNLFGFVFGELNPATMAVSAGFSASLGAIAAAWIIQHFYLRGGVFSPPKFSNITPPSWVKKQTVIHKTSSNYKVNISAKSELKSEVDRILDKINSEGFGSLTPKEKRTLDKARDELGK
jgi:membrane associated rhomboid family serine protease